MQFPPDTVVTRGRKRCDYRNSLIVPESCIEGACTPVVSHDSDELRDAVRTFIDVNKRIDGIIHANESATKFLGTLASILGGLKDVTGKVLS